MGDVVILRANFEEDQLTAGDVVLVRLQYLGQQIITLRQLTAVPGSDEGQAPEERLGPSLQSDEFLVAALSPSGIDSRAVGPVRSSQILAKAILVVPTGRLTR